MLYFKILWYLSGCKYAQRNDKGVASNVLMRNLPQIMIFCPDISEKKHLGRKLSLEIHKFSLHLKRTSPYLCESLEILVEITFWSMDKPPFWNRGLNMDFCDLVLQIDQGIVITILWIDIEKGLYRGAPATSKRLKIAITGIFPYIRVWIFTKKGFWTLYARLIYQ